MPFSIVASTFYLELFQSGSTTLMSQVFTSTVSVGIYTVSSDSLSLLNSASVSFGFGTAATNNSTGFAGSRFLSIPSTNWSTTPSFNQGIDYYMAIVIGTAGVVNNTLDYLGQALYTTTSIQRSGSVGVSPANATSQGMLPFLGAYSTTSGALPTAIANSEIRKTAQQDYIMPHVVLNERPALSSY